MDFEHVLNNNRFSALAPTPSSTNTNTKLVYNVKMGVPITLPPPVEHDNFRGTCHYCHATSHPQKQCPLRRCLNCFAYGHSAVACDTLFGPE